MSLNDVFENELLKHICQNADIPNIGDATGLRGSSTAGSLYAALHTADPGEDGDQSTNEATYTGYARKAIARNATKWPVSGNEASNGEEEAFPECTGGSNAIVYFTIGTSPTGTGKILGRGSCSLSVSNGITPTFAIGALTWTLD